MTKQEIEQRVRDVLVEQLACEPEEVVLGARFDKDLEADSLDLVEAILALEEELDVKIPEEEMQRIETVGDAVELVAGKLGVPA